MDHQKYAKLLLTYCLSIQPGDKMYVRSTIQALPLIKEIYRLACSMGCICEIDLDFQEKTLLYYENADDSLLDLVSPVQHMIVSSFDAYLFIRAPYNLSEDHQIPADKRRRRSKVLKEVNEIYSKRTATKELRRTLCQFPTSANAQLAGMSLSEYESFIAKSCQLDEDDPTEAWKKLGSGQQRIVDYLNNCNSIVYKNDMSDIAFSVDGRTWINSDGKTNMPSGEVFTSPVEDSVNGTIHFDYPSVFMGQEVSGITLVVKDGQVMEWSADMGQRVLDQVFEYEGARTFGEVAIGTNYNIQKATKNILFDEKIGGTIHMAVGQSYLQTGGINQSPIHWDMIADMRKGQIFADDQLIYENGNFLI